MRRSLLADRRPSVSLLGVWVVGVLLTTFLVAETAPAVAVSGDYFAPVASKRTSHQLPNFRKGIKNEINRYFGPEGEKLPWFETFRESRSRLEDFTAASATRWTFVEQRAQLKKLGFTAMSTKAMDSGPGQAWILVDGRYKGYRISRGANGKATYWLQGEQPLDDKGRPLWKPKVDANLSPGEQSKPVPDFSQPILNPVLREENVWPPIGAARYGMFKPDPANSQPVNVSQPRSQPRSQQRSQSQSGPGIVVNSVRSQPKPQPQPKPGIVVNSGRSQQQPELGAVAQSNRPQPASEPVTVAQSNRSRPQQQSEPVTVAQLIRSQQQSEPATAAQSIRSRARMPAEQPRQVGSQTKPPETLGFDELVKVSGVDQVTRYVETLKFGEHLEVSGKWWDGRDHHFALTPSGDGESYLTTVKNAPDYPEQRTWKRILYGNKTLVNVEVIKRREKPPWERRVSPELFRVRKPVSEQDRRFDRYEELAGRNSDDLASLASLLGEGERMAVQGTDGQGGFVRFVMEPVPLPGGQTGLQLQTSSGSPGGPSPTLQEVIKGSRIVGRMTVYKIARARRRVQ